MTSPLGATPATPETARPSSEFVVSPVVPAAAGSTAVRMHHERGDVEIPLPIPSREAFLGWALSDRFPTRGRIDYIAGSIEVDMSPEDAFDHSLPKTEIARQLANLVADDDLGFVYIDSMLLTHAEANLSTEPDVMFVSEESLVAGRARLTPRASGEPGKFAMLEGSPDLIVEIVSDSSVTKDTVRLPAAYFAAGVREFWLVDARSEELAFQLFVRGETTWAEIGATEDGFRRSSVFARQFRLRRRRDARGWWKYRLDVAAAT